MLTGLASASALFLVASGLSLIFGVTRIVNFAHGSFYMLGLYARGRADAAFGAGPLGFWGARAARRARRRRARRADRERSSCAASTARPSSTSCSRPSRSSSSIRDAALWAWGPEDLLGPEGAGHEAAPIDDPRRAVPDATTCSRSSSARSSSARSGCC